ncbi:MAG TPA: GNAT family N-acetyltransferase [Actinopolymorphaceae bacterium]|jgi:GNAT superfamily N-acetyltransferase
MPLITPAVEADLPRLLEIRHAAFAAQAPSAYTDEQVRTLLDDVDPDELLAMIADRQLFVARLDPDAGADGEVVGSAGWQRTRLRHVYVDPAHTRRGIATALLTYVESDFRRRTGAVEIHAGVALHAEGFYLATGYRVVSRETDWDGSEYLAMIKAFGPETTPAGRPEQSG